MIHDIHSSFSSSVLNLIEMRGPSRSIISITFFVSNRHKMAVKKTKCKYPSYYLEKKEVKLTIIPAVSSISINSAFLRNAFSLSRYSGDNPDEEYLVF